jgi:hypothetical protein
LTAVLRTVPVEEPSISFMPPRRRARTDAILAASLRAGSAAAAIAVVAITGLIALNGSATGVAAVDIERARSVLTLHEQQLQQMETSGQTQRAAVPRGLAAAERALAISGQASATVREGGRAVTQSTSR